MMKETFLCDRCGRKLPTDRVIVFDGQTLCGDCLEADTLVCQDCGTRLWREDNAGSNDHPLCRNCYDDNYTRCSHCGELLPLSSACYENGDLYDEHPYCSSCFLPLPIDMPIQDYCYKPEPIFYGDGPRWFGVELEIDGAGERADYAQALLETANREGEYLYIKHDGSLDDGLELVTHPMSLEEHLHAMPWAELCRRAVSLGYRSHRATTCGLHVHVSRGAFGATEWEQEAAIARVLYFFEKHWEELLKFSRRTQRQLERWAARYGYKEQPMEILDHAKKGGHGGRYTSVNLQNATTVEFRIFRGTLKCNTLIATLQLLDRICDVAISLSDGELKDMAWTTFVSGCQTPELVQYLKERRLYINEPMDTEEDL